MDSPVVPLAHPPMQPPPGTPCPVLRKHNLPVPVGNSVGGSSCLRQFLPPEPLVLFLVTLRGQADSYLSGLHGRSRLVQACWGDQQQTGQRGWRSQAGLGTWEGSGQQGRWTGVFGWPGASHLQEMGKDYRIS